MAKRKRNTQALKLYHKLVRITRQRFQKDPALKRSYRETQKWVSANLYPFFKGQPHNRVKVSEVQNAIEAILTAQAPKKIVCGNVFAVPDGDIEEMNWWEFFEIIRRIDPNVKARLNGGSFGATAIMPLAELDSNSTAADVISEIRSASNNKSGSTIIGFRRVVPNMKDDGDPCSYFIDFILNENGKLVEEPSDEVFATEAQTEELAQARRERMKDLKKQRLERRKKDKAQKRKRPKATKEEVEEVKAPEKRKPSDFKALDAAMKRLEGFYNKGLITKKEFKTLLAELIQKFEEGGEV
jgi:hypothetical protein